VAGERAQHVAREWTDHAPEGRAFSHIRLQGSVGTRYGYDERRRTTSQGVANAQIPGSGIERPGIRSELLLPAKAVDAGKRIKEHEVSVVGDLASGEQAQHRAFDDLPTECDRRRDRHV
jgi:hypothetical protein